MDTLYTYYLVQFQTLIMQLQHEAIACQNFKFLDTMSNLMLHTLVHVDAISLGPDTNPTSAPCPSRFGLSAHTRRFGSLGGVHLEGLRTCRERFNTFASCS